MRRAQIRFCTPHSTDRFTPFLSEMRDGDRRKEGKKKKNENRASSVSLVLTTAALLCSLYLIRKISQLLTRGRKNLAGEMFTSMLSWAQSKQFIPPEITAKPALPSTHRDLSARFIIFLSDNCIFYTQTLACHTIIY